MKAEGFKISLDITSLINYEIKINLLMSLKYSYSSSSITIDNFESIFFLINELDPSNG